MSFEEWISTWTFWNWLALVSFIILPLSALNAFLGLKARWKDWRATKSKRGLEKGLKNLQSRLSSSLDYRTGNKKFHNSILLKCLPAINSIILALILLVFGLTVNFLLISRETAAVILLLSVFMLINAARITFKLDEFIKDVFFPAELGREIIELEIGAQKSGLIEKIDDNIINSILVNNLFTEKERNSLTKTFNDLHKRINK